MEVLLMQNNMLLISLMNLNKAFEEFVLDHFKYFDVYPMEFEYENIVYDTEWVWNKLRELNLFEINQ